MSTKSREYLYGHAIRYSAEQDAHARKEADELACKAWNMRMLGYKGPAQPSPLLGDALNAGYLEIVQGNIQCKLKHRIGVLEGPAVGHTQRFLFLGTPRPFCRSYRAVAMDGLLVGRLSDFAIGAARLLSLASLLRLKLRNLQPEN
jgi:hypothetical protein